MSAENKPERHRLPKGERTRIRAEKARVRRKFAPSADQLTAAESKARTRLTGLNQYLTGLFKVWVGQTDQPPLPENFANLDHDTTLVFGRLMASYLTATPADPHQPDHALAFVEIIWLRRGLNHTNQDQLHRELKTFLDACPQSLQDSLTIPVHLPTGHWLSRLQQVRNCVFNPITGALDVRG